MAVKDALNQANVRLPTTIPQGNSVASSTNQDISPSHAAAPLQQFAKFPRLNVSAMSQTHLITMTMDMDTRPKTQQEELSFS